MLRVRDAVESDDEAIRDIFVATYGNDYAYPAFYDLHTIRKLIYADDNVLVVALSRGTRLYQESCDKVRRAQAQELERHEAAQLGIAGEEHLPHAAAPSLTQEL